MTWLWIGAGLALAASLLALGMSLSLVWSARRAAAAGRAVLQQGERAERLARARADLQVLAEELLTLRKIVLGQGDRGELYSLWQRQSGETSASGALTRAQNLYPAPSIVPGSPRDPIPCSSRMQGKLHLAGSVEPLSHTEIPPQPEGAAER